MSAKENTKATDAFSAQSGVFDAIYKPSPIVQYKRDRVRQVLKKFLNPSSKVLELNAGTGEDALWFAENGHTVLATDASPGMLAQQKQKFTGSANANRLESLECSFLNLEKLGNQTFDVVFSNFGGLNCTDKLDKVLGDAAVLLKPGGVIVFTIMPPNCFWEWLWLFTGKFKKAFRRYKKGGTQAHIQGEYFKTYYYKPSFVKSHLPEFTHVTTEALCLAVPPEHHKGLIETRPRLFSFLKWKENLIKSWPIVRNWGDYFIIALKAPE